MTQLKRDIIKKVVVSKDVPAVAGRFVNLHRSILVRGLDEIKVTPHLIYYTDFNPMFEDMITLTNTTGETDIEEGALFRIARDGDRFIGAIFMKGLLRHLPDRFNYITSFVMHSTGVEFKHYPAFLKPAVDKSADEFIKTIVRILYAATTYTPQLINPNNPLPKKLFYNKLSNSEKELYKEYTIDISKPRVALNVEVKSRSKEPEIRAEHERRGYWRTSKYGKKHFVKQTTVNKGAPRKIVKDYKV